MHLDEWHADGEQCVAHRQTGMRECRGIDDRAVGTALQTLIASTSSPS